MWWWGQFQVFIQFFMGSFDCMSLIGDLRMALERNLVSAGFWFDVVTSVPWSYLDYEAYQVCFIFSHAHRQS